MPDDVVEAMDGQGENCCIDGNGSEVPEIREGSKQEDVEIPIQDCETLTPSKHDTAVKSTGVDDFAAETEQPAKDNNAAAMMKPNEALTLPGSEGSINKVGRNDDIVLDAKDPEEHVREPVKRSVFHEKQSRAGSLPPGIDIDNVINIGKSKPQLTPPTSSAPTSSYSLRNRGAKQGKLAYDLKYHPMDDLIRPSQAAKRRSAHGEEQPFSSDDSSEASMVVQTDAEELSNEESEDEEEQRSATNRKKRSHTQSRTQTRSCEVTRRSSRKVSDPKVSYNMDIHPQDKYLVISSDDEEVPVSANKRRKLTHTRQYSVAGAAKSSKTAYPRQSQRLDAATSDAVDSDDRPVMASVETVDRTSSPIPSIATPPPYGLRRKEGMDVWHLKPGERYFRHDRDAWPFSPGQPFEIFNEHLEDQLAREALAASPLNYEHNDKENNVNNGDMEPVPDPLEGISVMPLSQYIISSDDARLSQQHTLLYEAFGSEPATESYGLGGTDGVSEGYMDATAYCIDILTSGHKLPQGQTQEEPYEDTQDSVLGGPSPVASRDIDSVISPSSD